MTEKERSNRRGVSKEDFESFVRVVDAKEYFSDKEGILEYHIDEPRVKISYDSRGETPQIKVSPGDPMGVWEWFTSAPASEWGIDQTIDGDNLLTTLYYDPKESDLVCELCVWGLTAKSIPEGIEIENEAGDVDPESHHLISV